MTQGLLAAIITGVFGTLMVALPLIFRSLKKDHAGVMQKLIHIHEKTDHIADRVEVIEHSVDNIKKTVEFNRRQGRIFKKILDGEGHDTGADPGNSDAA